MVSFHINDDSHAAGATAVQHSIHFVDLAADAGEDGNTETLAGLAQQRADLHLVAFLDDGYGRSSDVLKHREDSLFRDCCYFDGLGS